jgi:NAD(P)H-quinone oxidoreductase subunit 2
MEVIKTADLIKSLNLGLLAPEYIVTGTLLVLLLVDLIWGRAVNRILPWIGVLGMGLASLALIPIWSVSNTDAFLGAFTGDPLGLLFRGIILISAAVAILMSDRYIYQSGTAPAEFFVILLTATLGAMLLSGSSEMVMIYVALETLSIASYLLSGYTKLDVRSNEAALKYLLLGAASSAIFLYGMSLLYGLSGGETKLTEIAPKIATMGFPSILAMVLVIAGISFKLAAVPFHQWTPDVYQGAPTPVVGFLSVGSKAAGFALAIRFMTSAFPDFATQWHTIFAVLGILSMILGNVVAIAQTSMKRMLAYSSIAQAGYVMIGLAIGTPDGYASMIYYMLIYLFMNMGAFLGVVLFALKTGTDEISAYAGLYQKDPFLTLCMSLCLFSLAGFPPLAGFFGKLYLFWAGIQAGAYTLVFVGLVTSVASIYYYVRVVKLMVVKEPSEVVKQYTPTDWTLPGMRSLQIGLAFTLFTTVALGLASPILNFTKDSIQNTPILLTAPLVKAENNTP